MVDMDMEVRRAVVADADRRASEAWLRAERAERQLDTLISHLTYDPMTRCWYLSEKTVSLVSGDLLARLSKL